MIKKKKISDGSDCGNAFPESLWLDLCLKQWFHSHLCYESFPQSSTLTDHGSLATLPSSLSEAPGCQALFLCLILTSTLGGGIYLVLSCEVTCWVLSERARFVSWFSPTGPTGGHTTFLKLLRQALKGRSETHSLRYALKHRFQSSSPTCLTLPNHTATCKINS